MALVRIMNSLIVVPVVSASICLTSDWTFLRFFSEAATMTVFVPGSAVATTWSRAGMSR